MSLMFVLTGSGLAQQIERLQGTNLLSGKKAIFSVAPNCSHCNGGDETDLTDGDFWQSGSNKDFWSHEGTVGWEFGSLAGAMIRFDLGQVQPIRTLGFDTVSGKADVSFPAAVVAYVSDDGKTWHYVTDLINEALPQSSIRRRFVSGDHVTGGLRTRGRHLAFYVVKGSGSAFVDEIEALRGNRHSSEVVFEDDGIDTDQLEDDALNRARSLGRTTGSLGHLSAWFRNHYATLVQKQKPVEKRKMDRLERYVAIDNRGNWPNLTRPMAASWERSSASPVTACGEAVPSAGSVEITARHGNS